MRYRTLHAVLVLAAAFMGFMSPDLAAQQYPTKIIRVINPNQPGGNSDILFRLLSPKMGEILGQQLVVDYRPGAGGNIGAEIAAKSAPDGYTTLIAAASFMINPSLIKNLPFDAVRDFTPLGLIVNIPAALLVHPSLPVKSVKDLIALAKARPGELNYSSSGIGAVGHLSGALFSSITGAKFVHIPYKGAGPAIVDLVAGQVQFSFVSIPAAIGHVQSGRLRMLAQCGATRFPTFPEPAHHDRGGRARLRGDQRLQLPGTRRHAAARREQAQRRAGADPARPRDPQNAARPRRRTGGQYAGRTRSLHQDRDREVAARGAKRRA